MGPDTYEFAYNGLGDRLRQTINAAPQNYTLDLEAGLTQVLSDEADAYLYGVGRIGQSGGGGWQYYLGDALASVRQLVDQAGSLTLAKSYVPFGGTSFSAGTGASAFAFAGDQADATGLVYMRARYLGASAGRFLSRDAWDGDPAQPMSYNPWIYVGENPVNGVDHSGKRPRVDYCDTFRSQEDCLRDWIEDHYEPNSTTARWDPPPYVKWDPPRGSGWVSDLPHLDEPTIGAQFSVPGHPLWCEPNPAFPDDRSEDFCHNNMFCGQISVALIVDGTASQAVDNFIRLKQGSYQDNVGTTKETLVSFINHQYGDRWLASTIDRHSWFGSPLQLKGYLARGLSVMSLVTINNGSRYSASGGQVGIDTGIDHWVVITGMSRDWHPAPASVWNWVRIYNPFTNWEEYYRWSGFLDAWENADGDLAGVTVGRVRASGR